MPKKTNYQWQETEKHFSMKMTMEYYILLFQILLLCLEFKITLYFILLVTVLFSESGEKNDDLFSFLSLTLNIIISMPFLTASRIHYNNISLLKLMMSCPNLFMKRWSVVNISSGYTSLVGSKRSPEFLTLQCTHILKLTFFWHFHRHWSFFVNNSRHRCPLILKYV